MPGTREGGLKAARTNKETYGDDFYQGIGAMGGSKSQGGGFASMSREQHLEASRRGGERSKRAPRSQG